MKILSIGLDNTALKLNSSLANRLIAYGELVDKYDVVVPSEKDQEVKISKKVTAYGISGINKIIKLIRIYFKGLKLVKLEKYNIITIQDPFELALIGWLISRNYRIGLNVQEHGDFFGSRYWRNENLRNFFRYYLGKFIIKRADSIRVVSQRIKNNLIDNLGIAEKKIIVVPVYTKPVDVNNKKGRALEESENKFIFLTMGRFVKQKNLNLLIESFKRVVTEIKMAHLVIIGRGVLGQNIRRIIDKYGLRGKITIKEWVDDVYAYYRSADAYVLSSNYEGWGLVIIEAANAGLPIIMTDVGCAGEVIKDGEGGLIVPANNPDALAKAMIKTVKDEALRVKITKGAKEAISKLPDKKETLKLYKESWEKAILK